MLLPEAVVMSWPHTLLSTMSESAVLLQMKPVLPPKGIWIFLGWAGLGWVVA